MVYTASSLQDVILYKGFQCIMSSCKFPAYCLLLHSCCLVLYVQRYDLHKIICPFGKYQIVCPLCLQSFFCSGFANHLHVRQ